MQYIKSEFKSKDDFEVRFINHGEGNAWGYSYRASQIHRLRFDFEFLNKITQPLSDHNKNKERILEIGCAGGDFTKILLDEKPDADITGIDISENAIEICKKKFNKNITFLAEKLPSISFPEKNFDTIICMSVFSYFDTELKDMSLKEMIRLAKPNGILFIEVPDENLLPKEMETLVGKYFDNPIITYSYDKLYFISIERILLFIYRRLYVKKQLSFLGIPFGFMALLLLRSSFIVNICHFFNKLFWKQGFSHILIGLDMKNIK
jgi:2-polyprenyl-3-methyl-5-hydroxy-6-metoxy-1,4-benzoquinol methylase